MLTAAAFLFQQFLRARADTIKYHQKRTDAGTKKEDTPGCVLNSEYQQLHVTASSVEMRQRVLLLNA